jgi:hypothetical protein
MFLDDADESPVGLEAVLWVGKGIGGAEKERRRRTGRVR